LRLAVQVVHFPEMLLMMMNLLACSLLLPDSSSEAAVAQEERGGEADMSSHSHGHVAQPMAQGEGARGNFMQSSEGGEHSSSDGVDHGFRTVRRSSNSGGRRGGRGGGGGGRDPVADWRSSENLAGDDGAVRMVVLVGVPGSGKSTISNRFRERGWVIVSQGTLRVAD
jgi:hypothetical protein